ncbi:MAG: hypothetical protein IJ419_13375 [Agathobacter sp.]|nr:hypothetical protein [Agathobacter sp.]
MVYRKYEGNIPYSVGDTVEFTQTVGSKIVQRRGVVKRIDEFGNDYNMHVKCEYVSPLGCGAVVYPLKETVTKVEI